MEHALPARSPRNKKKKNPGPYKKTQALIHKKKKKKKKQTKKGKKKKNPKTQTVFPRSRFRLTLSCDSSLQLHIHTNQPSVFQSIKQTDKKKSLHQQKILFVLCDSEDWTFSFVFCNNRRLRRSPVSGFNNVIRTFKSSVQLCLSNAFLNAPM